MTVKQSFQGNVDWQFCFRSFAYLFFLLFRVLVCILINVTNFTRNERIVYIFDGEKTMPIFEKKIKLVCKLKRSQRGDAEMWQREGTLKQMSFRLCLHYTGKLLCRHENHIG